MPTPGTIGAVTLMSVSLDRKPHEFCAGHRSTVQKLPRGIAYVSVVHHNTDGTSTVRHQVIVMTIDRAIQALQNGDLR